MTCSDQRWHVEGSTQVTTSPSADPRFLFDGAAGSKLLRIQSRKRNPLARVQAIRQYSEFAEYLQSADLPESRSRQHQMEPAIQFGVAGDQSQCLTPQVRDPKV